MLWNLIYIYNSYDSYQEECIFDIQKCDNKIIYISLHPSPSPQKRKRFVLRTTWYALLTDIIQFMVLYNTKCVFKLNYYEIKLGMSFNLIPQLQCSLYYLHIFSTFKENSQLLCEWLPKRLVIMSFEIWLGLLSEQMS